MKFCCPLSLSRFFVQKQRLIGPKTSRSKQQHCFSRQTGDKNFRQNVVKQLNFWWVAIKSLSFSWFYTSYIISLTSTTIILLQVITALKPFVASRKETTGEWHHYFKQVPQFAPFAQKRPGHAGHQHLWCTSKPTFGPEHVGMEKPGVRYHLRL